MSEVSVNTPNVIKLRVTEIPLLDRIILLGPPGIGKTEIIRQKAEEEAKKLGKIFVDLRETIAKNDMKTIEDIIRNPQKYYVYYRLPATHVVPEDLGIPRERRYEARELILEFIKHIPPLVLAILSIPDIYGTIFFDEINNVQRDDQITLFYSIIQEKEAGFDITFSRNIKIVLAGNTSDWSEVVRPLPKPLRNRTTLYYVKPPTPKEWVEYMERKYGDEWEKACGIYLQLFPDDILKPPAHDEENFPSPRSWTECCRLIYELKKQGASKEIIEATIVGRLGSEVGAKFAGIFKVDVDIKALMRNLENNPEQFDRLNTELKILVLSILASQPFEVLARFRKLFEHMSERHRELLAVFLMIVNKEAKQRLVQEEWFNKIVDKLIDLLVKFV